MIVLCEHPAARGMREGSFNLRSSFRYGNRWHQNLNGTASPSYTYDANNRITTTGIVYDAMGNITNDGRGHTYTYDAEGRMITADSNTYWYDAVGRRFYTNVGGTPREFLYDVAGHTISMSRTSPSSWDRGEIYAGGWHIASYAASTTQFNHADWLGTVRVRTGPTGAVINSYTSLPFGDCFDQNGGSTCDGLVGATPAHFTDQDRDTETGLDHFMYRQHSSVQGRWMMPDPAGMGAVDAANPQTWNQYAYVVNDPLDYIDPLGLCPKYDDPGHCTSAKSGNSAAGPSYEVDGVQLSGPVATSALFGGWATDLDIAVASTTRTAWIPVSGPRIPIGAHNFMQVLAYQWTFGVSGDWSSLSLSSTTYSPDSFSADSSGQPRTAANNATPWYKSCTAQALLKGAGTTALDAIGILPEGGTVSAAFSLFHGAAGVSNGIKIQQRAAFAAGIISTAAAGSDLQGPQESTLSTTVTGLQATVGGFGIAKGLIEDIPVAGQAIAIGATALDLVSTGLAVVKCY